MHHNTTNEPRTVRNQPFWRMHDIKRLQNIMASNVYVGHSQVAAVGLAGNREQPKNLLHQKPSMSHEQRAKNQEHQTATTEPQTERKNTFLKNEWQETFTAGNLTVTSSDWFSEKDRITHLQNFQN